MEIIMAQVVIVEGYGPVEFPDGMSKDDMAKALKKLPPKPASELPPPAEDEATALPEVSAAPVPESKPVTKEDLLADYNSQRTMGQMGAAGVGSAAGLLYGGAHKMFPKPEMPSDKAALDAERKLAEIRRAKGVEAADLRRALSSTGLDVNALDEARLMQEATPALERQLAEAERKAVRYGSSVKPSINIPPISNISDIADIVQHSGLREGESVSSLASETGQHELAHQRSQAGKVASKTAEDVAKTRGTSYGNVLTSTEPHMPTTSGRVLIPQQVALQMEQEATQALQAMAPMREAAEAEIRRLKALGKDTSGMVSKLKELQKQETLARQILREARASNASMVVKAGVLAGRTPVLSGVLGGAGTALSAYDLANAETPLEIGLGGLNTTLGVASMLPPVNPVMAGVKGVGTLGSLAMIPVNIGAEALKRRGIIGKPSLMEQRRAGSSPNLVEKP
jgi:nucleotide-binding universal stress UspA family protein